MPGHDNDKVADNWATADKAKANKAEANTTADAPCDASINTAKAKGDDVEAVEAKANAAQLRLPNDIIPAGSP